MEPELLAVAESAKGFMPREEGLALYAAGLGAPGAGPFLEIGSYCGKSAVYLGAAARERGTVLFSIDHHRGSVEIQPGWEHHDPEVVDPGTGRMDTLPFFRRTIARAGLEDAVYAIVGDSVTIAGLWRTKLALVFIDGAHSPEDVRADYEGWAPHVGREGLLVFHDVYEHTSEGGQGPRVVYERALASGAFELRRSEGSLRVLRRVGDRVS